MVTSANTSINKRIPALFNKIELRNCQLLDYGCGKYPNYVKQWGEKRGISVISYDKYNYCEEDWYKEYGYDAVCLSNVLNVVNNWNTRWDILQDCWNCLRIGGQLYITVYEGDKNGIGRITKADCWQENRRTADYLCEVGRVFGLNNIIIKNNVIVATKTD